LPGLVQLSYVLVYAAFNGAGVHCRALPRPPCKRLFLVQPCSTAALQAADKYMIEEDPLSAYAGDFSKRPTAGQKAITVWRKLHPFIPAAGSKADDNALF